MGNLSNQRPIATQAQAEAGTANTVDMTPLRVAQAVAALGVSSLDRSPRTANAILVEADRGTLIDITSGTFTQTFTAAATLAGGWFCYYRNSGSGNVTIPSSDGVTNWIMYPGETRLFQCDGVGFNSIWLTPFNVSFTASGTFVKPPGYMVIAGRIRSAGSSGERNNNAAAISHGGAGGGCADFALLASLVGATETVTIGAGGAAVTGVAVGNVGGSSSFGTLAFCYGSASYSTGGSVLNGAAGDYSTLGAFYTNYEGASSANAAIGSFWGGGSASANASADAKPCLFGGGAGGCISAAGVIRAPGASVYGGSGGAASVAGNGIAGSTGGGGGGATQTGAQSGAGGDGSLRLWGES